MDKQSVKLSIPGWAAVTYIALSIILLPWTVYLGLTLPVHHLSNHWDVSWVGLDAGLALALLSTGILAYLKSRWIIITTSMAGSFLLIDAWFDVMSQRKSLELHEAIILAIAIELPLALLSFYVAYKTVKSNVN